MRQLFIQVPRERGSEAFSLVQRYEPLHPMMLPVTSPRGDAALVIAHVSNGQVEPLIDELQEIGDLHVSFSPNGILSLQPPPEDAPQQVADVQGRSPLEIFLSGLQSVGSWHGFLGYAAASGAVVWIGLLTDTIYLLTAAMLIAPFAGPAMNAAIATARGDLTLLGRSLARYFGALAVSIGVAALLSLVLRQQTVTEQMAAAGSLSMTAVLLPLVAGAAGALNLSSSPRNSLVSGAATGMLVAASLAPPAGLIGMAGVIGRWDLVMSGAFVLFLQIAGINVAGTAVFRIAGLRARGTRYPHGRRWAVPTAWLATALALAALFAWQLSADPELQRKTQEQRASTLVQEVVEQSGMAELVEADFRFARSDAERRNVLLGVIYVERRKEADIPASEVRMRLEAAVEQRLVEERPEVTPLLHVTVLERPEREASGGPFGARRAGQGAELVAAPGEVLHDPLPEPLRPLAAP